jgi:hypothetical protein
LSQATQDVAHSYENRSDQHQLHQFNSDDESFEDAADEDTYDATSLLPIRQ